MDIIKEAKVDWLGLKWFFIGVSALLIAVSAGFLLLGKGLNLGVDFTGGTLVYLKFRDTPDLQKIRSTLSSAGLSAQEVTRFDEPVQNEVQIRMAQVESDETGELGARGRLVFEALTQAFDVETAGQKKTDLNNISRTQLSALLQEWDLAQKKDELAESDFVREMDLLAARVIDLRTQRGGLFRDFSELQELQLNPQVEESLRRNCYLGSFTILSMESVGPKVGRELRERAQGAVLFSLIGMLIYIAFRFRPIFGLAAILALFHDVFITVGLFAVTGKEVSLTVIAALLTLVGYSINDTIVIFDRVRENQNLMRRSSLYSVINTSINQTLNRTILTSGMTFLAVFSLYLLGGEALSGFSFALVIGILVGTYSSVAIASPVVLWWQNFTDQRKGRT